MEPTIFSKLVNWRNDVKRGRIEPAEEKQMKAKIAEYTARVRLQQS
jgi:hypothetical protein